MEEESVKSVKDLVGVFELVSKTRERLENRSNCDVNSDIEMLKLSPVVTKYRDQLQKDLEKLMNMKEQLEHEKDQEEFCENLNDNKRSDEERQNINDEIMEEPVDALVTPLCRSRINYSNSTLSGARANRRKRPPVASRTTFINNVGIVCATKTTDNDDEASKSKKNQEKLVKVLEEIVSSEKVYIRRLSVLDDLFRKELSKFNREEYIFQWDSWDKVFSNLSNIRRFHEENLLPWLEDCLRYHLDNSLPKCFVGKVFSDLGPYLKMYSEYAQKYKNCLEILDTAVSQSLKLKNLIAEFESQDICEGLKIRYFYIEPIQRLPRYELLLREYTCCLSDDSEDLVNAHIALKLVKQANIHSNDSIKNEENFFKIRSIEDSLRDSLDLLSVPRQFIREGSLDVVLPICGRVEERRMILFSDLLLLCQYYPHPFRPPYCVTDKLNINLFQVKEVRDRIFLFGPQAIVELLPRTAEDRAAWKRDLESVARNNQSQRFSVVMPNSPLIETQTQPSLRKSSIKTRPLGVVAPIMMKEQNVQACMECTEAFGILNRKRSCFACGRVICKECGEHKEPLAYLNFEIKRVCNKCHDLLQASPNFPSMF